MGGPGFVDIGVGARCKPKFLCNVDDLSRVFAENLALAQATEQDLKAMPSKAHLLGYGQAKDLYNAAEMAHFKKEWLSYPGYFPGVNVGVRFQVIRAAFQDACSWIARTGKPVISSWKMDASTFHYDILEGDCELFLTFHTPTTRLPPSAAATYEPDESVCVGHYDEQSDEIIRQSGHRQVRDPAESGS